jgi:hypothetical protein
LRLASLFDLSAPHQLLHNCNLSIIPTFVYPLPSRSPPRRHHYGPRIHRHFRTAPHQRSGRCVAFIAAPFRRWLALFSECERVAPLC